MISGRDQDEDEDSDDDYKIKYDGLMRHYPIYSALLLFHSLKEFKLDNDPDTSFYADDVIKALNGHTCLRKLSLSGVIIEMKGFSELASMRQNPMSNLTTLHLHNCKIDSDGMIFFAGCLSSYSTLKELTISSTRGKYGWQPILFTGMQRSNIKLTGLDFSGTWINNDDARSLSKTLLCHNATIKNLSLGALVGNLVTVTAGWSDFFESLRSTNSALETLNLCDNTITNGTLITLERALINNSRLRELCLQGNSSVTPEGWKTLSRVLRNPNSSLEVLDLRNNRMSDKVVVSFAEALANNHRLRELKLDLYYKRICNFTSDGLAAFYRVLCDNTIIMNTYYSNHTLERIFGDIRELTFDIEDLSLLPSSWALVNILQINNESNKSEVARLKIIMEHFSFSEINMQIFADMELNVRPHAIAWMAQDNHLRFGVLEDFIHDNHLYSFLRTLPSLLERQRPSTDQVMCWW
jgi:Ran GTPase-activating protein (RanGAP) involved in mRNA processing and transport